MRAIDGDALQKEYMHEHDGKRLMLIDVAPTIEPEPKKGKWIRKSPTAWSWTCSCCKKDDAYAYSAGESFEPDVLQDLFCPNCGADMREGELDEAD